MYDQYPMHDLPQNSLVQRFLSQRWSAIALEIVMTIVITIAAGAAFDFFDPLDGEGAQSAATVFEIEDRRAREPVEFIKERGEDYARERRFVAAGAMFDWLIALEPEDAAGYSWRGYVKMQSGDYIGAQADYLKLLELRPADFDGHNALCWAYGETKDFAEAKAHCRQALQSAGERANYAIALENWCWLQVEMGEYEEAAQYCRFALEYAPEYEEAHALSNFNMGRVYVAQGKVGKALPHFAEALRIGSSYPKMYLEIGAIYDTLGYSAAARSSYAKYRELFGSDAGRGIAVGLADGS